MRILPIVCRWMQVDVIDPDTGEAERRFAWVPLRRYDNLAKRQNSEGDEHPIAPLEPRSRASHDGYFAELHKIFENLPENLDAVAERLGIKTFPPNGFVDIEHFRAWCLCEVGCCSVEQRECDSHDDAVWMATTWRKFTPVYGQISVRGNRITIKEPLSQSAAAMSKEPFEESKRKVLDLGQAIIGVTRRELRQAARTGT